MIVVATRTSASPRRKASIVVSSSPSSSCPCASRKLRLGHERAQPLGGLVQGLDPVVEEEDLALAADLALDRPGDELLVVGADVGADRAGGPPAASRSRRCRAGPARLICIVRGIGVADIESTSTRSLSWRRSSFCLTPKRCSSSITSRPRSLARTSRESSRWVPIRMSSEPVGEGRQRGLRLRRLAQPRDHLDLVGEVAHALGEGAEVLGGEDRRRDEHHHLLGVGERLLGGADRDLGLAVADVAADQPVHRPLRLHVGLDRLDRLELVGGLAVGEGALEPQLPLAVGAER